MVDLPPVPGQADLVAVEVVPIPVEVAEDIQAAIPADT